MVLPIPLSATRLKNRGYNQTTFLAYPVSQYFRLPYQPYAIYRTRNTRSQVGLNGTERRENLKNAFAAVSALVQGKKIVIIDDVFTTGSTLNACAQALKAAGASQVFGLTLGRPLGYADEIWDLV